jgi:hypothetical protein
MHFAKTAKKRSLEVSLTTYLSCALVLLIWQFLVLSLMSEYQKTGGRVLSTKRTTNTSVQELSEDTFSHPKNRNSDFAEGTLNLAPTLHRQCVTVRFRGDINNYTVEDAVSLLAEKYLTSPGPRHLRMGIMIMEDVSLFLPVRIRPNNNNYQ